MKITCLVENTTQIDNIECEHGLSLFIEHNDLKILFDMVRQSYSMKMPKSSALTFVMLILPFFPTVIMITEAD